MSAVSGGAAFPSGACADLLQQHVALKGQHGRPLLAPPQVLEALLRHVPVQQNPFLLPKTAELLQMGVCSALCTL